MSVPLNETHFQASGGKVQGLVYLVQNHPELRGYTTMNGVSLATTAIFVQLGENATQ